MSRKLIPEELMPEHKKKHAKIKTRLHPNNKHRERYNFEELTKSCPELSQYVHINNYGDESIEFSNPKAVRVLNKALLQHFYDINNWDFPEKYLCPPIPGRADYIHHIADLLRQYNYGKIPQGPHIKCFDIGVGANCIYPLIGSKEYGWSFIGSDIDSVAIESANKIILSNPKLIGLVECRIQANSKDFFYGAIKKTEFIDLTLCNPPFHASAKEARESTLRKLNNLNHGKVENPSLNFGGQSHELYCNGGEEKFITDMIRQSEKYSTSCFWFSTLISKKKNLTKAYNTLKQIKVQAIETIPMGQGNKTSRIVAWTFLSANEQSKWRNTRWNKQT